MSPYIIKNGKAYIILIDLNHKCKKIKTRKIWGCEVCNNNISINTECIKIPIWEDGTGNYDVYIHKECIEIIE